MRRKGHVTKNSQPLEALVVTYNRTGYQIGETRITFDRDVSSGSRTLDQVVIEVKGPMPKWLRRRLPKEDKQFSKSKWAGEP